MAWTSAPTTGHPTSTVFPKIRSQALLQAAERRSQDKGKMTASDVAPAIGWSVGNVNATPDAHHGKQGKAVHEVEAVPNAQTPPEDYVIVIKPRQRVSLHEALTETGHGTTISS
ncbi:hypothetical protein HPB48_015083 [Haemaphysalis longicornis]|uniref:Uncharacterized protein n=1 Tax=Haemaphysalis longicornis TaxID=44386 RepID=A0A9J6GS08_HAELO|nr:hypothetical protein HPB48_015083 [Haemaphysalis longicornis]